MSDDKLGQCAHGYYGLCPHCYDSLRAELAELRARVKEVPRTTEWHIAMREANQIHDADAYFAARSEMLDSGHNRHLFEAGYQRGFDAGEKVYAGTAAAAVPGDVAKDAEISDSVLLKAYTTASNGEVLSHSWRPIYLRYARIGIAAILAADTEGRKDE